MDERLLINLLDQNYSVDKICLELNCFYQDVFDAVNLLKEKGIYYYQYFDNKGEIYYTRKKINGDDPIKLKAINGQFSTLSLSDIHVGSMYDDEKRLDIVSNFILRKDIHYIFNTGDNIDGLPRNRNSFPRRIPTVDKQIEEFLRVYPQSGGLVTICSEGDHDLRARTFDGKTFNEILKKERHDIKAYSSGYGIVKLNNTEIMLCHDSSDPRIIQALTDEMIMIAGHSHFYDKNIYFNGKNLSVRIINPSLSRLPEQNGKSSGFLKIDFDVYGNDVACMHVNSYIFDNNNNLIDNGCEHYSFILGNNNCRKRK